MMPPEAPHAEPNGDAVAAPAAFVCAGDGLVVLRKRADFLLAARAKRQAMPGFILQARKRSPGETSDTDIRIGFTCSKKVGNAVARNRAKRRLREIARKVLPKTGQPGWDYVLIGRRDVTAKRLFETLVADLGTALSRIHKQT